MPRYVTRIVATELAPDALNPEPWLVEWIWEVNGRPDPFRAPQDSRAAARQLTTNLLKSRKPGLTREDVLTVHLLGDDAD